jgi:hypothetical protein
MATDVTDHRVCDQIQRCIPPCKRLQGAGHNKADVVPGDRLPTYNYLQSL